MFKDKLPFGLIDSHAHLNEMENMDSVIQRAKQASVNRIVAVGMDMESNIKTLRIADQYSETVFPAIGYHPWSIREEETDIILEFLRAHLKRCCALGEVGLDYKVKIKKHLQQEIFSKVLSIARVYNTPVIIHSRYSYERTYQMVCSSGIKKAVFHWYSGPLDVLNCILKSGYYISATPALAYSKHHQAAIVHTPLRQILVETDCPVRYQGRASEPCDLIKTLKALSELKKEPMDVIGKITTENANNFFGFQSK